MKASSLEPAYPVPVEKVSVVLQVLHSEMPRSSEVTYGSGIFDPFVN
jgi:hypothetical protein